MLWYVCCDESPYPGFDLTGFVKRWESMGGRPLPKARLGLGVHQLQRCPLCVLKFLGGTRAWVWRLIPKAGNSMACGPQEETSEQAVNPTAILRAMRTAIA